MKKIVYIAHPIGGDVKVNLEKIKAIVRNINLTTSTIIPFAPYWLDCHALDDDIPEERARGIANDQVWFERNIIDELWLYGDKISTGMMGEIQKAITYGIPIFCKSKETQHDLDIMISTNVETLQQTFGK